MAVFGKKMKTKSLKSVSWRSNPAGTLREQREGQKQSTSCSSKVRENSPGENGTKGIGRDREGGGRGGERGALKL